MAQENKELLLRDLCARLPYNCRVFYEYVDNLDGKTYGYSLTLNTWCINEFIANKAVVKPYLRPMSSMIEEERKELNEVTVINCDEFEGCSTLFDEEGFDYLNAHHFDYRELIPMGLALEAKEGMYNYGKNIRG